MPSTTFHLPTSNRPLGAEALAANSFVAPHQHAVQFYQNEEFLYGAVAGFLSRGLEAGQPLIVIATELHRKAFVSRLEGQGFAVQTACENGQLTLLDASEILSKFMVDSMPVWDRFMATIGPVLEAVGSKFPGASICAYGEMVDLLFREGKPAAAIRLEEFWNDLGRLHSFDLFCAYVMGNFYNEGHREHFDHICRTHTHVIPTEEFPQEADSEVRFREVAVLQQRALALENEIEHRKRLETALRDALAQGRKTEEALREKQAELAKQNADLSRTVRFSELFVGILGHDLRNPLSAIATAANLLSRRADSDKVAKPARRILSCAERMARMIDQLLDFAQVRLGKGIPLERRPMDLSEICRLAVDEFDPEERDSRIRLEMLGEDWVGTWDGDKLAQLVSNLVGNALNHGMPTEPVWVRVDGRDRKAVTLEVHNRGTVSAEVLAIMFEPFKNVSDRKSEGSSGLGLGLYISDQIVSAHAGKIEVFSSEPDGTRFVIRLPRSPLAIVSPQG